jgi:hypothetical protein
VPEDNRRNGWLDPMELDGDGKQEKAREVRKNWTDNNGYDDVDDIREIRALKRARKEPTVLQDGVIQLKRPYGRRTYSFT